MNSNRKPFRADLIVFVACCLLGTWWIGFEYGKHSVKPTVCPEIKPAVMYESRGNVQYWRNYTKGLPK